MAGLIGLAATIQLGSLSPSVAVIGGSPLLDRPAPPIVLRNDAGRQISLASYRGRPVIVNFWASWCLPCKQEFPLFKQASVSHASAGLEIIGIVYEDTATSARAFMTAQGATWPMLLDPSGKVASAYHVTAIPVTFFVDRSGIVRYVSFGPPPSETLDEELARILGSS